MHICTFMVEQLSSNVSLDSIFVKPIGHQQRRLMLDIGKASHQRTVKLGMILTEERPFA